MNHHSINRQLRRIAKSRRALSTVATSLIILVISVLLAGVVTYFAVNVTSTRVQEENLALTKQHAWFDGANEKAEAAIMVINAGGRDVVIDKLTVRGQICAWSKVYYTLISGAVTGDLSYSSTLTDGCSISVDSSNRVFKQATGDLTVQSGKTLIIYISDPDSISVNDVGLTVSITVFTSQAMYHKETNVQGASGAASGATKGTTPTHELQIVYASVYNVHTKIDILMVVKNTGSAAESCDVEDAICNGKLCTTGFSSHLYACGGVTKVNEDLPDYSTENGQINIQTYTLTQQSTFTLNAGDTAIVYFMGVIPSSMDVLHVGDTATVGIHSDSDLTATKTITVEPYKFM